MVFLEILWDGILPLIVLIGAGIFLDSRFKIDLSTYNKLIIWVTLPCFVFYGIYNYTPSYSSLVLVPLAIVLIILQYFCSSIFAKLFKIEKDKKTIFKAISTYSSIGYIGISLVMLIYSRMPYIADIEQSLINESRGTIVLLLLIMLSAIYIFEPCQFGEEELSFKNTIKHIIKMPSIYAIILAILVKTLGFHIETTFLWSIIKHYIGAFMILVLISVGMQINRIKWKKPDKFMYVSAFAKLIINPVLAYIILKIVNLPNPLDSQVFFIYSSISSSFLTAVYANEHDKYKSYVLQSILFNTILGIITMSTVIYISPYLFPIGQ